MFEDYDDAKDRMEYHYIILSIASKLGAGNAPTSLADARCLTRSAKLLISASRELTNQVFTDAASRNK